MTAPKSPPKTDWIAWVLHALVGAACGLVCGAYVAYRRRRYSPPMFSTPEAGIPFVIGAILLGAAFGSYLGERWWSGPSLFRTHPEGFEQSRAGRMTSVVFGVLGVALMVIAVLHDRTVF